MKPNTRSRTVRLAGRNLSFKIPIDWEEWDPPEDLVYLASSPVEHALFEPQLTVTHESVEIGTLVRDYFAANFLLLEATMPKFNEHACYERKDNGTHRVCCEYSAEIQGFQSTIIDFYIVKKTDAYLFHCKCAEQDTENLALVFQGIGDSIKLSDAAND